MAKSANSVKSDARPWLYSVLLHGAVLVVLLLGVSFGVHTINKAPGTGTDTQPVQATVVSQKLINEELEKLKAADARKKAAQEAAERKRQEAVEAARKAREAEQARLAKLQAQQAAAQKAADAAAAKRRQAAKAEEQRLAKLRAEREAQEKQIAAAKAEAARKKAAAEEAERKRKAAAEAAAKAEAARKADLQRELAAERKQREEAAAAAKAARERSRALGSYVAAIKQQVVQNWLVPPSVPQDLNCVVDVTQVPGGDVVNAVVKSCNADDAVKQSIISAVYKASPLPQPSDPSLFDRQLEFTFTHEDVNGNAQ